VPKKKPSWTEKLQDSKGLPKVEKITEKMSKRWGNGTIVIPAPIEVDSLMKRVPARKLQPSTRFALPSPKSTTPPSAAP